MKAAIFDMDGTLVDSLILWDVLWEEFGQRYLGDKTFRPTYEDNKKSHTLTLKDAMELIHCNYGLGESGQELLDLAIEIVNDFYANRVELKPGVKEFLEHCKANGVKMCIASASASKQIEIAMTHCGVKDYFLKIFSCNDIGKGKEEPDIYLLTAEFMGESLSETWVFEDSLTAIETAAKIGMPTVGIYEKFNFGHEEMKKIATEYIDDGETMMKLVNK